MQADRIGIDSLSFLNLPPVESVHIAADLGCRYISIAFDPLSANPHGYPIRSLRDDAGLRRDLAAVLKDRGVSISVAEGFMVTPGTDIGACSGDLDLLGELGVSRANILSIDRDRTRSLDQIGSFVALADARGIESVVEFVPGLAIGTLSDALAAIRHIGSPNLRLVIDCMHLIRSGSSAADVAALDPDLIGYAQICDVPLVATVANYSDEACHHRLPPGEGELPLLDILAALPRDVIIGLEVPMAGAAEAGIGPYERLKPCVESLRALLDRLE
jgi:sugar phosphate isomerase/epimerase